MSQETSSEAICPGEPDVDMGHKSWDRQRHTKEWEGVQGETTGVLPVPERG